MNEHFIVTIPSALWIGGIVGSILYIVFGMTAFKSQDEALRALFARNFGLAILVFVSYTQIHFWLVEGTWDARNSLPLQLCDISFVDLA